MPTLRRDDWGLSWIWKLVALVIVGAVLAGTYSTLFGYHGPTSPPALDVAESGDAVQLDYIGYFDDGRVFDTSVWDVATDNATYAKSPGFSIRTRAQYAPLDFFVDGGTVIQGFNNAALGMRVGQSRTVNVPPDQGYGLGDPALRRTRDLVEEIPLTAQLSLSDFASLYLTEAAPLSGSSLPNPIWGWNVTVLVSGDLVTVRQAPVPGSVVRPYGRWEARVELVDDAADAGVGVVRVRHLLTADAGGALGASEYGSKFVIRSVDEAAGTWLQDFNSETTGVPLNFQVTLVSLTKA